MGDGNILSEGNERRPAQRVKKFSVTEIFGPTIQGEGIDQGVPCYFVRFGGCDFKCTWCDTPHAVLPQYVRRSKRMTEYDISEAVRRLTPGPQWVVLSGGNPAMHDLEELVFDLHCCGYKVAVETQGTKAPVWLADVDRLCVSPKPPSSGHKYTTGDLAIFFRDYSEFTLQKSFLKVVVFDQRDYAFAAMMHNEFPELPFFLSAGNDAGATVGNPDRVDERLPDQVADDLIYKGRWLANMAMVDRTMKDARVQMQQHVLYWGNEKGR